ncbi:hypothetical protein [Sphingomonas sp.]|uniref:hypothetical protein n=1 Tax=Sphingomonas sp. TaxID=28214 RepID=UPI0025D1CD90|nr:hypothetical protein [Sphingomonas sp.]
MRRLLVILAVLISPAAARTSLGTFEGWGTFRDERPTRCYAIAQPIRADGGKWRSFASVSNWPQSGERGQVQVRLSHALLAGAPVVLTIGVQRFALVAGGADAWSPDQRTDAALVAAMRSAPGFTVRARAATGRVFSESYALKGAATAIDAAALGCARR